MRVLIDKRLQTCMLCSADGATAYRIVNKKLSASLMLCASCFEHNRLPPSRSEQQ
jgi:hypothetical protein